MKTLILNAGSSTYKLSLFEIDMNCLWKGKLDWGTGACQISAEVGKKRSQLFIAGSGH